MLLYTQQRKYSSRKPRYRPGARKEQNMREYDIYDISSDEPGWGHYLGTVRAFDTEGAEWKACGMFPDIPSNYIAAFSKEEQ